MNQFKGILYGILSSSTFGLIPLFALPAIAAGVGIDSVMLYRFGISALVVGSYLLLRGHDLKISLREMITLFGLGLLYASTALFLTQSYLYIPSGIATTIHFLYPVVVTVVMILFFKDRVSFPVILATGLAVGGVCMLSNGEGEGSVSFKGLLYVLLTVVTYALYIVGVNKSEVSRMDGLKMTFYILFACAVIFGINLLVKGQRLDLPSSGEVWIYLILLALIPTLVSDLTLILAVQNIGSTTTAVLGCMEPLTAVGMGVLFLGEHFGFMQLLGMLVVVVAVTIIILTGSREMKSETVTLNLEKPEDRISYDEI